MRKILLFILICSFVLVSVLTAREKRTAQAQVYTADKSKTSVLYEKKQSTGNSIAKVSNGFAGGIIFYDDFEPGVDDPVWTTNDLTNPPPERGEGEWLVDSWEALGDSSWRLADTSLGNNGGYNNGWYQVLDTPPILMNDTSATLTFYHRYAIEGVAGATAPYDGWDACNVRISLDNGETWIVLPHESYNMTSSWAFGHPEQGQFEYVPDLGIGSPVPGWGGEQPDWVMVEFDLKEYVSPDRAVMIRFAFASDMGYSTGDGAPELFGWQIDSIRVASPSQTFFFNDGQSVDLVGKDNSFVPPVGGDLWHVAEFTEALPAYGPEFVPTPTHGIVCQVGGATYSAAATYNTWMENTIETGPIALPDTFPIYLDFKYIPDFADPNDFPDVDFWWAEVMPVDSAEWEAVWLSETGYYVFSQGFDQWVDVSYFYGATANTSGWELSRFAGQEVYLRLRFHSDYDDPLGSGLLVDDFVVYSPVAEISEPTGLTVTASNSDTTVHLSWDYEEGKVFQVWRTTPGDQYVHLLGEVTDSVFVDVNDTESPVAFYQEYLYTLRASVKYEGVSGFADLVSVELIPENVYEFAYDDGTMDTTAVAPANKLVLVKFTPEAYPVDLTGFKIYLDNTGATGTAGQFSVWADNGENGKPGTQLVPFPLNKSGLLAGFNKIILTQSIPIDSGSYYISYKRFGLGLTLGVDTTAPTYITTYKETATIGVYDTVRYGDGILHALVDITRSIPREPVTGLYINEFMASNNTAVTDEYSEYDDWLEIYNANVDSVDVGGLYLTDDLAEPYKWMIPDTSAALTTIPPGGFILFWADGQMEQGVLHADFKLSGSGEEIGLVENYYDSPRMIDSLIYGAQHSDTSYGRSEDGGSDWVFFNPGTPGASNSGGTVVSIEEFTDAIVFEYRLNQNYPNPFNPLTTIEFGLKNAGRTSLNIYNSNGQKVATLLNKTLPAGAIKITWDAGKLASGVYFYELKSGSFRSVRKMILMK